MAVAISKKGKEFATGWAEFNGTTAQTNLELVAAPGAGRAIFIDYIHISNLSAANTVELRDGSGGSPVWRTYCPAAAMFEDTQLPHPKGLTMNTGLFLNTTAAAGHSVVVLYHIEVVNVAP